MGSGSDAPEECVIQRIDARSTTTLLLIIEKLKHNRDMKLTKKEKAIYNKAIKKCARLVQTYDGIIPIEFERYVIVNNIIKFQKK